MHELNDMKEVNKQRLMKSTTAEYELQGVNMSSRKILLQSQNCEGVILL